MKYRHYSPDAAVILIEPSDCVCVGGGDGRGGQGGDSLGVAQGAAAEALHRRALEEVRSILQLRVISETGGAGPFAAHLPHEDTSTSAATEAIGTNTPFRVALLITTAPPGTPLGLVPGERAAAGGLDPSVELYLREGASLAFEAAATILSKVDSATQHLSGGILEVEVVQYVLGCREGEAAAASTRMGPSPVADTGSGSGLVARGLFAALRLADELRVSAVVVEGVADRDEGAAVMNRLRKAASRIVRL